MNKNIQKSRGDTFKAFPPILSLSTFLGLALLALGLIVISGWLLQVRAMVEIRVGFVAMVFNTALCFALAGLALALPGLLQKQLKLVQSCVGILLFSLCGLVLIEHFFDINLHIDWGFLHTWLHDGNTRPGRLAPNTALGFMCTGAGLCLLNRIDSKAKELCFQILIFLILAIGLTGLIGYLLSPDQLFGWARSARMAIHTAIGMIAIGVALWTNWHHANSRHMQRFFQLDEKISFMSAAILCVATLTAGLTGFVFQQAILEDSLREKLQFKLDNQRNLIHTELTQALNSNERIVNNTHLLAPAYKLALEPENKAALAEIQSELLSMRNLSVRSASIVTLDGKVLLYLGEKNVSASTRLLLANTGDLTSELEW
ncbi:MAG: hypothetical protein V4495_12210, partial [Pseudomonadota bacterium]